ncbi:hypothetical protein FVER53590_30463 [Fusarium verticillioides]|nr:hypothetical protein FVER53590_30463 [Fusarium verticillioides]
MTKPGDYSEAVLTTLLDTSVANVNRLITTPSGDTTPLILAIKARSRRAVQLLTDHVADITIPVERNGHRITPVLQAAACHSPEEVEILQQLLTEASSKERTAADISLAHIAALHGHFDSLQLVLEYGADANGIAKDRITPLHEAASNTDEEKAGRERSASSGSFAG